MASAIQLCKINNSFGGKYWFALLYFCSYLLILFDVNNRRLIANILLALQVD